MSWYITVLKKYAVFSGRARRKEFWMFVLINFIIGIALGLLESALGIAPESKRSVLGSIYQLAIFIPSIALSIRRMHDTDRSGWWTLVPIANLVFYLTEGTKGENRFGPDPKSVL